ncbi:hypothetical protein D9613_001293 [Agrocybe pediades]|uniref:Uncharacterized protein n=1 Tax=Agrocybe pediades TaxID=84607 RepID=A0A8H4VUN5_9AGAR|nr:hypothetical protein D9613_001293 [Agrocybe pediades]
MRGMGCGISPRHRLVPRVSLCFLCPLHSPFFLETRPHGCVGLLPAPTVARLGILLIEYRRWTAVAGTRVVLSHYLPNLGWLWKGAVGSLLRVLRSLRGFFVEDGSVGPESQALCDTETTSNQLRRRRTHHHLREQRSSYSLSLGRSQTRTPTQTKSHTQSTSQTTAATATLKHTSSLSSLLLRKKRSADSVADSKRARQRRELPPEIWAMVLRFAAVELVPFGSAPVSAGSPSVSSRVQRQHQLEGSADPLSFLSKPVAHAHLSTRIKQYNGHLKWKASLTRVCRAWNWMGQEVLYEDVWITKGRDARALAGRLCGDAGVGGVVRVEVGVERGSEKGNGKDLEGGKKESRRWPSRIWKKTTAGLASFASSDRSSTATAPTTTTTVTRVISRRPSVDHSSSSPSNAGRYIRRLHVETLSMEKCSPHDLLLILQYAPNLEVYEDYKSVRRPMHPLALSVSPVVPFSLAGAGLSSTSTSSVVEVGVWPYGSRTTTTTTSVTSSSSDSTSSASSTSPSSNALLTSDALLHTLLSRPLKRLSWTNYDYDPRDYEGGIEFFEDVVGPRLAGVAGSKLEYLEVGVSWRGGHRLSGGGSAGSVRAGRSGSGSAATTASANVGEGRNWSVQRSLGGFDGRLLTQLEGRFMGLSIGNSDSTSSSSIDGFSYTLALPALLSLKVALDDATFSVLSTWDMPALTHLSVLSADFGYAGGGFRRFFEVHGEKIGQLELGHSSGDIEEAWLTGPPQSNTNGNDVNPNPTTTTTTTTNSPANAPPRVPLNAWCPNLKEFICSADAEWNWQAPDWIAPHVLLPAHEGLVFIGVRGMERRLRGDGEEAVARRRGRVGGALADMGEGEGEDDTYFMLLEQFGSLLRREAFPNLRRVRDMSWESDVFRRTGRMGLRVDVSSSPTPALTSTSISSPNPAPTLSSISSSGRSAGPSSSTVPAAMALSSPSGSGSSVSRRLLERAGLSFPLRRNEQSKVGVGRKGDAAAARDEEQREHEQQEDAESRLHGARVRSFWRKVVRRCEERGVVLEDWRGERVGL